MSHESTRIILLIVFSILLLGSLTILVRVLLYQINTNRLKRGVDSNDTMRFSKIIITMLLIFVSTLLFIFILLVFGFPEYEISKFWKIIGGFGLLIYWFLFGSFITGLGLVTGISGLSTSSMIRELFRGKINDN
jgi:hypothetical protein